LALNHSPELPSGSLEFYADVVRGLNRRPKTLPCKYFYDAAGSALFEKICGLEEYYLTRTERGILEQRLQEIRRLCGPNCILVELGSGSSSKTRLLLDQLDHPAAYVPIDIAIDQLEAASRELRLEYPNLEVLPICADYHLPLEIPRPSRPANRTVIFFPGSTIGNLEPEAAGEFLRRLGSMIECGDGLLIGVDLQKSLDILEAAYNDRQGVTAAFNLNLLCRINRELGASFHEPRFQHRAIFNSAHSRIEMHLVSLGDQQVRLNGYKLPFSPSEFIVTEHSYKYSIPWFSTLAARAGFKSVQVWTDARHWFGVWYLEKHT
jgi:dimethylhistidine N-methyltransferase